MTQFQNMVSQLEQAEHKNAFAAAFIFSCLRSARGALNLNQKDLANLHFDRAEMMNGALQYLKTGKSDYV